MGCDIHMHVEYKDDRRTGGVWANGNFYSKDEDGYHLVEFHSNRNYELFAILADVRNYDHVKCIAYPKGFPVDATEDVAFDYIRWGIDAHSASYFTLKELIDFYEENRHEELYKLIVDLKQRADDLNVIWDFQWKPDGSGIGYEKSDNIRIVFWFDN